MIGARGPVRGAPAASRPARVVAVEPLFHKPTHQLPQRHLRVDMRQQPLELFQPALALLIDHRLELPAASAQRPDPIRRHHQLRIHLRQHLHHLPRALSGRLIHQRLTRRDVQLRHRLPFRRWHQCRRRRRRAAALHGRAPRAARRARPLPITPLEGGLQLRGRVQRERAVPQPLARSLDVRAQFHGVDPPPRGGGAVAQPVRDVVEQTREPAAQIQLAGLDLEQVIDDEHLDLVIESGQLAGLLQQLAVRQAGDGGENRGMSSGCHAVNIIPVLKWSVSTGPGRRRNQRSERAERGRE